MMFQIKNKKHHPKGWCFSELAFRANSPGGSHQLAWCGRRDLPGLRTGAVPRENRPLDAFLTRGLQVPYLDKQKTIQMDGFLFMVRKTGLEPVWSEPHAPQTCASASSATSA